jgi:hypothetical protein
MQKGLRSQSHLDLSFEHYLGFDAEDKLAMMQVQTEIEIEIDVKLP